MSFQRAGLHLKMTVYMLIISEVLRSQIEMGIKIRTLHLIILTERQCNINYIQIQESPKWML